MEQIGKYKVLQELGRGGFGAVYLCEDNLGEKVAIKVFDPKDDVVAGAATSATSDATGVLRERFQSEARTLRRLSSNPYIVDLYDFDTTEDDIAYYVMPFLEQSLVNEIGRDVFSVGAQEELAPEELPRPIPAQRAIQVLTQVLEAMKTVHQEGLVHRDLKPANILFDKAGPAGKVQVCDFGIAKLPDTEHSQSGVGMGSRNYMSKEQRESAKHVDASSDVYAIGVMAYRMLTGTLPDGRFQDPIVYAPSIGPDINDLIIRAMSVDAGDRPQDASVFLKELKAAVKAMDESAPEDEGTGTWVEQGESSIRDELKPLRDQIEKLLLEHGEIPVDEIDALRAVGMVADLDETGFDALVVQIEGTLSARIKPIKNYLGLVNERLARADFGDQDKKTLYAAGKAIGWDQARVDALIEARSVDLAGAKKTQRSDAAAEPVPVRSSPPPARQVEDNSDTSKRGLIAGLLVLLLLGAGGGWWFYDQQQQGKQQDRVAGPVKQASNTQDNVDPDLLKWNPGSDDYAANIAALQTNLNKLGYSVGRADGVMGQKTTEAIRRFQRNQNLAVTGSPSNELEDSLAQALAASAASKPDTDSVDRSAMNQPAASPSPPVRQPSRGATSSRKDYALVIGTDQYDEWNDLPNPVFDATTIARELEDLYGFEVDLVVNPTKGQLEQKIYSLYERSYQENDQVLIYIAGHGWFMEISKQGYLVLKDGKLNDPIGSSYYSYSKLRDLVDGIPAQHVMLALDSVYGGTFDQDIARAGSRSSAGAQATSNTEFIERNLRFKSRIYLTAGVKAYVRDGRPGQHSPFSRQFLAALRDLGGSNGILTRSELKGYMEVLPQMPRMGDFGTYESGSNFLFVASGSKTASSATQASTSDSKPVSSKTTARTTSTTSRTSKAATSVSNAEFIKRKLRFKARIYLTAGGKEYVRDRRPGKHSPFSKQYLAALTSNGGSNGILTKSEVKGYMEVLPQMPRMGDFGSYEPGSDFLHVAGGNPLGKDRALVIGTDTYDEWGNLPNPVLDAKTIARELKERYGFEVDLVLNATKSQLEQKIYGLYERSYQENDQVLIYIAGHGQFNELAKQGYLVPKDGKLNDPIGSSYFSYSNLRDLIDGIPSEHVLLILDAVFGGTFDRSISRAGSR